MTEGSERKSTDDVSIATSLAGISLSSCIYNASGPRTGSSAALAKIAASASGAVLTKSATLTSQSGNPQPRTWHENGNTMNKTLATTSLNSEGLPNYGIDYYISPATISEALDDRKKPYMVSISGSTLNQNLDMLTKIHASRERIAAVELNLACPNVIGKPIIAYDFDQMDQVLKAVTTHTLFQQQQQRMPLGVKLPPYFDNPHFERAASIIQQYPISYVASINTIGNALAIDTAAEMPVLTSNDGYAGLSGPAIHYTALANVSKLRTLLPKSIDIVGVGGITSGKQAFDMILCGAQAVQVGTCHWMEGPSCFERIGNELQTIMREKGYSTLDDFRGKLKPWNKEGAAWSRNARNHKDSVTTEDSKTNNHLYLVYLNVVLILLIAVLMADKFGVV